MSPERYLEKLRALCRRLPDTAEKQSWGHPNFTAGGRMFAAAEVCRGRPSFGIATSLEEQSFLVEDPRFAVAPYVGKHGWVTVWLDMEPEWPLLEDLLRKANARVRAKAGARASLEVGKSAPEESMTRNRVHDPAWWLTTERLALRRFTSADFDWLLELYGNSNVMRHMGGVKDRAKTQVLLDERILAYYDAHPGLGIWVTVERATGERLGMHLLNHIQGEPDIQVGYVLCESAWGRGVATEMAAAVLRYGFVERRLPRIVGITNLENRASQHVLEKIGLVRRGERSFAHPAYASQGPMAWFERDAGSWLAQQAAHE